MVPMSCIKLNDEDKASLLHFSERAVEHAVQYQKPLQIDLDRIAPRLCQLAATFVTLHSQGHLAGCIGSLKPTQTLIEGVLHNAHSAAFMDSRFEAIQQTQLPDLQIEISVLSNLIAVTADSEQMLIEQLNPREHGLVIEYEERRATFLPRVWDMLPEKAEFVARLKEKGGLPADFWSSKIQCYCYTAECFSNF